jgi:hypothetical protein
MGELGSCVITIARNLYCAIPLLIARKWRYVARMSPKKLHRVWVGTLRWLPSWQFMRYLLVSGWTDV